MSQLTLQEIQGVLLEMMKDIHQFCVSNGIQYSLAYGTLIGAIRHKGFIPWDDDIDIWMPRPDYERFINEYKGKYELKQLKDKDYFMGYARVYDKDKTYAPENYRSLKEAAGVWVDVLPLDGVSDKMDEREKDYEESCRLRDKSSGYRTDIYNIKTGNLLLKAKSTLKIVVKGIVRGPYHTLLVAFDRVCQRHPYGETECCANYYCFSAYKKRQIEVLKTSWFKEYILSDFEDAQFMITKEYDTVLRSIFGDYMKLPPKDKRGGFHTATFYWKS